MRETIHFNPFSLQANSNYIFSFPIPNQRSGIKITVAEVNAIGDTPANKNTISGNGLNGVYMNEKSDTNIISNNYILIFRKF